MSKVQLIVGLGNPGPEYEGTRHNAGFWFVDRLPGATGAWKAESRFHGQLCRLQLWGHDCRVLKPATFMNRSGQSIAAVCRFFRIPPEAILVVHDDLDLPPGTARLKRGGGAGGHNGLKDTIAHLGPDFLRLRLGVGHPGNRDKVVGWVLKPPTRDEEAGILAAIDAALEALPPVLDGELARAMNRLHSR